MFKPACANPLNEDWILVPKELPSPQSVELTMENVSQSRTLTLSDNWAWKQKPENESDAEALSGLDGWQETKIPSEIFKDLLETGDIPDPHLDQNENEVQWVGEVDWLYRTRFVLDTVLCEREKAVLTFDGLDTFADVYFNDTLVLRSENMFHEHRIDVTSLLKLGLNYLGIVFHSALKKGREELDKRGKLACWNGESSRLYVRKSQYHWGWDWGPVSMSAGPWKPIRLEIFDTRIGEYHFPYTISMDLSSVTVDYTVSIEYPLTGAALQIELVGPDESHVSEKSNPTQTHMISKEYATIKGTFKLKQPKLWYPVNYGKQHMYKALITLSKNKTVLDEKNVSLGFRRAHVVQKPLQDSPGTSFHFEINNIPIFCGGSNWIPADTFLTRLTAQKYRDWLNLIVKGNQNMIRVWGGGIYEDDKFYEIADELGILIWQDFPFACGQYPAHPEFLASIEKEVAGQLRRLREHPSIVLFAGNNEDYQIAEAEGLEWDPNDMDPQNWLKTNFPGRYIYEKLLPELVSRYAPSVFYHPGSPWGGGKPTRDPTVGDIHQWNVWHGNQEPYQCYPQLAGRFVSEFGMQSLPSPRTLRHFITNLNEYYPQSQTMDHHNKAAGFEKRLNAYILENYRLNTFSMEEYSIQSQRMQADAVGEAFRGWRKLWQGNGREYTSGALVWQFNDCWPCISWSIVDYFLRPKLAWYAIKRELRPINVAISRNLKRATDKTRQGQDKGDPVFDIWGTNSTLIKVDVDLSVECFDITTGKKIWKLENIVLTLPPNQSTAFSIAFDFPTDYDFSNIVISVFFMPLKSSDDPTQETVTSHTLRSSGNWPQPVKYLDFSDRQVSFSVDGEEIILKAEKPIKSVILDVEEADDTNLEWSDNGFDIMPGEIVKVIAKGLGQRTVVIK